MANGKQKKSKKKLYIFGGIGILVVALILIAFLGGSKENIIAVQTEKVMKRDITQTVTATGTINPEFKVIITPEVTGEIIGLPVQEGDMVRKGDLLIKIQAETYLAQKERADAVLQSTIANLSMRKAELDKVKSAYDRVIELHAKGLASNAELEIAKSNYLSSKALYESQESSVLQSKASVKEAIDKLSKTSIFSPMDGTISQLNVEKGERVLGSGFSQGTNIMTVSDLNNMEATVEVDENDVVLISVGDTARIEIDAFGDKIFRGIVTQIGNSAKTAGLGTQDQVVNFEVRIKLIDVDKKLRPGMSCTAKIETETIKNVLSIPLQSVTARNSFELSDRKKGPEDNDEPTNVKKETKSKPKLQEIVFVLTKGKADIAKVKTGISDDNYIQIISGLDENQEVVTGSYRAISRELKKGSTVRVERKRNTRNSDKN
ncbi:MAG: efflux RND transporter periplasmic adaptor subunit [Ignavibacteriales bacterium CG12_big_fil_rev_8_21_14_0_65_30_8]|nr:MAG: efflux RND transporter periplasmic adaptor subunit [Ignavibacteriales bacterium CG12_big_fil_rev_8_21_14_0_65_30_8]